ncbi:MAG: hypothetical protein ABR968_07420 [Bacteroidales bacterium]
MKNIVRGTIILSFILFCTGRLFADSPITSTDFYSAYYEYAIVVKAHNDGVINDTIANYLLSDTVTIGVKAAIINALSWNFDGKQNATLLMPYIQKKYKISGEPDMKALSADDLFCLGYLTIMDNYFQTDKPLKLLALARAKKPNSYTINIILALVEGQQAMATDFCRVFRICEEVERNKSLSQDMKEDAVKIIFDYIIDYKASCKDN